MINKELPISDNLSVETLENDIVIHFTNPKMRNPLSVVVLEKLHNLFDAFRERKNIKKIIFTGSENIFASGADLREIAGVTGETAREFAERGQSLMKKVSEVPQTTIAVVNGFCFGGALDLALSCDLRIASPNAVFCHPGANLGIITGWGGTQRLPRLVGEAAALEMFMTAKIVKAEEALKIGLISGIYENPLECALQTIISN